MMVDKYFLHFDDGTDEQISPEEWDQYKVGEEYPKEESLEAVDKIYKENERLKDDLELYKKVNLDLRKELTMIEKLIELNMKDLWDIADQRDWYYEEYRKLKDK